MKLNVNNFRTKNFFVVILTTSCVILYVFYQIVPVTIIKCTTTEQNVLYTASPSTEWSPSSGHKNTAPNVATKKETVKKLLKTPIGCYRAKLDENTVKDFGEMKVRPGKSIFFHETSCTSWTNSEITLSARQACAVESAAFLNPTHDVYLTFSAPAPILDKPTENSRIIKSLLQYKNIKIAFLNYEKYVNNTHLQQIYQSGQLEKSPYAVSHSSDILRYLTLYKFGGIYMDMDVIVIKSLDNLGANYAGAESNLNVAAGVIKMDETREGRLYAEKCVLYLKKHYNPQGWGDNGPKVISSMVKDICGTSSVPQMIKKGVCGKFHVYPEYVFYPIRWEDWNFYFDPKKLQDVIKKCEKTSVLHVWNKHSEKKKLTVNGTDLAAYTFFAKTFCPRVFRQLDHYF